MFKAVFLDMDGTTLDSHHTISPRTAKVLQDLSSSGIIIAFATGRSIINLRKYVTQLNLSQPSFPLVCYNGGYGFILHKNDGNYENGQLDVIFGKPLQDSDTRELLAFAAAHNSVAQYYHGMTGDVLAVPRHESHYPLLRRYAELVGNEQIFLTNYDEALSKAPSAKILMLTESVDELLADALEQFGDDKFTIIRGSPDPFFAEFLAKGITKGEGVRIMCEHLSLDLKDVVAFGDGDNDQEMLSLVGMGCAMMNARKPAKQAAKIVIQWTNDEEGVARQLKEMFADILVDK